VDHIIPENDLFLFWMCDLIALARCYKLISFLYLTFAVLLENLKIDVFSSSSL